MTRIDGKFLQADFLQEVPTGSVNSSNTSYTLAATPVGSSFVQVFLNGILQRPTTDYSVSGSTITFTVAPTTDSDVWVEYWKKN